jgi:hypothetical protein
MMGIPEVPLDVYLAHIKQKVGAALADALVDRATLAAQLQVTLDQRNRVLEAFRPHVHETPPESSPEPVAERPEPSTSAGRQRRRTTPDGDGESQPAGDVSGG